MKKICCIILCIALCIGTLALGANVAATADGRYIFEAEASYIASKSTGTLVISSGQYTGWNDECTGKSDIKQNFLTHKPGKLAGTDVVLEFKGIPEGIYNMIIGSRQSANRGKYSLNATVGGKNQYLGDVDFSLASGNGIAALGSSFYTYQMPGTLTADGDTITLTMHTDDALDMAMCIDKFLFVNTSEEYTMTTGAKTTAAPTTAAAPTEPPTTKAPSPLAVDISMSKSELRTGTPNGLRFFTDVDIAKINQLISEGAAVTLGTLIAPTDIKVSGAALNAGNFTLNNESNFINVPYSVADLGKFNANGFVGSISNIKESATSFNTTTGNITRTFIARGWCMVTKGGETVVSYAPFDATKSTSLAKAAKAVYNDKTKYDALGETDKTNILRWANTLGKVDLVDIQFISFSVNFVDYKGVTGTENCMLMLPTTYSATGEPCRLIIDNHGFSGTAAKLKSTYTWTQFFAHNGYAVLMVDGGGSTYSIKNIGNVGAVRGNVNAYKYVADHYNIKKDGVFVKGGSMGGMTAQNLVCRDELREVTPILGQINESGVTNYYRQIWSYPWDTILHKCVARFNLFDFTGTGYTLDTFPYGPVKMVSAEERALFFANDNWKKMINNNGVWKYMNCYDMEKGEFKEGFENYLTSQDESEIEQMYSNLKIDYPVPLLMVHSISDGTVQYKWSKRFADAINRGNGGKAILIGYEGTDHGLKYFNQDYVCSDGSTFNTTGPNIEILKFMQSIRAD